MGEAQKRPAAVTRYEVSRLARRMQGDVPKEWQTAAPMVVWRASPCRCWVLRIFLTPEGWVVNGRQYPVPMDEFIEMTVPEGQTDEAGMPLTLENYRAGKWAAVSPGRMNGINQTMPLDIDEWPTGVGVVVGCDHGHEWRPITDLAADCRKVRATRAQVRRTVQWSM